VHDNHNEAIKSTVERIQHKKEKWELKIENQKQHNKHIENTNHKMGMTKTEEVRAYLTEKRKRDLLQHSESVEYSAGRLESPNPTNKSVALRTTWRGARTDRGLFSTGKHSNFGASPRLKKKSTGLLSHAASAEEDQVFF
jgi:hypothetical protein